MSFTRADSVENILAIAMMDYHARRFAEAERGCRAALKLVPDDANALYLLGLVEIQLGKVQIGLPRIKAAVEQDPSRIDRACELAVVLARLQRLDDAVAVLGQAVIRAPESAEAFQQLVGASRVLAAGSARGYDSPTIAATNDNQSFSVVVCSVNPTKAKRIRQHYETLFNGRDFEIVQISDARSLCDGYNRGFAKTRGDVVIFSHDDIEIVSPGLPARLLQHLSTNDVVGVAGTSHLNGISWTSAGWPRVHGCVVHGPYDNGSFLFHCFGPPTAKVEALDGLFIAAKRRVCETIQFDAETFDGFHFYDLDFSYRAFLSGFRIAVPWDILIIHAVGRGHDAEWNRYAQKFVAKYGNRKIIHSTQSSVRWPVEQFSDRAQMLAFHRAMTAAQGSPPPL